VPPAGRGWLKSQGLTRKRPLAEAGFLHPQNCSFFRGGQPVTTGTGPALPTGVSQSRHGSRGRAVFRCLLPLADALPLSGILGPVTAHPFHQLGIPVAECLTVGGIVGGHVPSPLAYVFSRYAL